MEAENVSRRVHLHKPVPPSAINCLPIEILAMIFTFVGISKTPYNSPRNTTFPFNVASTCLFWMEILKSFPEHWKFIYIDVVAPTPFLDTFTVFTNGPIEVCVFSSVKESAFRHPETHLVEDIRKCDENLQAQIIRQKLEPFMERCASITFDLIFQSSLPSATSILVRNLPHLKKLILKCDIYDIDDNKSMIIPDDNYPPPEDGAKRPVLDELSVPGYSFSQISQLGQKWLSEIGGQNKWFTLSVDRFTLQKDMMPPYDAPDRTFEGFMDTIENMACTVLYLSDLTFRYRPPAKKQGIHFPRRTP